MDDSEIVARTDGLADGAHRLEKSHVGAGPPDDEPARPRQRESRLVRARDRPRSRRPHPGAGQDPDTEQTRGASTVGGYGK